jgi:hypothetical protein
MMLEFVGFHVGYSRLLRVLGTTEYGTPHSRIQRLSHIHKDIVVTHRKGNLEDIIAYLDDGFPVGIFVYTDGLPYWSRTTGHAVIVVGYSDDNLYLNDPAFAEAPQIASHGNIELAWEGYNNFLAVVQRK